MNEEELVRDVFEENGLYVTVNKKYDVSRHLAYFRVYTYVGIPPDQEKISVEFNVLDSVYDSDRTEELLVEKAEAASNELRVKIVDDYIKS